VNNSNTFYFRQKPIREEWNSGVEALTDALNLEAQVTRSIREIITTCENPKPNPFNDYHVSI
jgi:ferritin